MYSLQHNVLLRIDNNIYDIYFKYLIDEKESDDIAIIEIDQHSLDFVKQHYGYGWPWPRKLYGDIITYLELSRARTITIDLILSEPSVYGSDDDMHLKKVTEKYKNIITVTDTANSVATGIGNINAQTTHVGFAEQEPDADGKFRKYKFFSAIGDMHVPSLSLASFLVSQGNPPVTQIAGDSELSKEGTLLKFKGPHGTYPAYSAGDILQSMENLQKGKSVLLSPKYFSNKNIFIGGSAPGLLDLRPSPVDPMFNGVEIQATAFDNLLSKDFVRQIHMPTIHVATCFMAICILLWILQSQNITSILFGIFSLLALIVLSMAAFKYCNLWLPPAFSLASISAAIAIGISVTMLAAKKARKEIQKKFSHYLDKRVIDYFEQHHDKFVIGGEEKYISVLFTDIQNFSSISSRVTPEVLVRFLNEYLSIVTGILLEHDAIIDKYEGDAVIAFWGGLGDCENHELLAMQAVLECRKELALREDDLKKVLGLDDIRIITRFGLHAGHVIVGNIGTQGRFDYTIIGGNVNIASRLEGANKAFGTEILCSEEIAKKIANETCELRDLGYVQVVNIDEPIHIYTVFDNCSSSEMIDNFTNGIRLFHDGAYEKAISFFKENLSDGPSRFYLEESKNHGGHSTMYKEWRVVQLQAK